MKATTLLLRKVLIMICLGMGAIFFAYTAPAEAEGSVLAIVDDFDNADSSTNFLGLATGAGNFDPAGDLAADYDVFGGNPDNPLNTAHQISWDAALGTSPDPEDAFWYSFVNDGSGPVIPIADYTHLWLKLQAGQGQGVDPTIDIIGIDLQVNYPNGEVDQEGKPFRIYRAYQAVCNAQDLDIAAIPLADFIDEYDPQVRFTDNLAYNIPNLRAIAMAMTDHTDAYLTIGLDMDHRGTIFVEDVSFWNKSNAKVDKLLIDDFEDVDHLTNCFGYATGGVSTVGDSDVALAGSVRHEIIWDLSQTAGQTQYWRSDLSNNGQDLMDLASYTHLAYDMLISADDTGDIYDVALAVDDAGVEKVYSFKKSGDSHRISEEYIPLDRFRDESGVYITPALLQRVKEIRLIFAYPTTFYNNTLGDYSTGVVWIDNLRLLELKSDPLYNYPPLIATIAGQDVSYDFSWYPVVHRNFYGKAVTAGQLCRFNVAAGDTDSNLSALTLTLPTDPPIPTGDNIVWTSEAAGATTTGTFSWVPQAEDIGTHRLLFTAIDAKGARDIQQFDIIVQKPNKPPVIVSLNNINDSVIYVFGTDPEDKANISFSYKIDTGGWTAPPQSYQHPYGTTGSQRLFFFPLLPNGIPKGTHTFQVKCLDREGLESGVKSVPFTVR